MRIFQIVIGALVLFSSLHPALAADQPDDVRVVTIALDVSALSVGGLASAAAPAKNTLGWTTTGTDLDRYVWDTEGSIDVVVQMGSLVAKKDIASASDYIMELDYAVSGSFWYDGDFRFDPVNGPHDGAGDDPCPNEPFPIFDVYVNGGFVRTVEGWRTSPCALNDPEFDRSFEIKPVGDDPAGWVRIPKGVLRENANDVRFQVRDHVLPAYMPSHSKAQDGWKVNMKTVMIELAAPPVVLSHGWTTDWDPAPVDLGDHWLPTLRSNIKAEMNTAFGQNAWRWVAEDVGGGEPIAVNTYDRKQDWRASSSELAATTTAHHSDLGFSGRGWMHGHSMGGLVSRNYVEALGGSARIAKLAQTASPNTGAIAADAYTFTHWSPNFAWNSGYEAADGALTARLSPPDENGFVTYLGWREWWTPAVGAYNWTQGPGHGRDHLADFGIKPTGSNPLIQTLNGRFPGADVEYFTVLGAVTWGCSLDVCGDGVVSRDSGTLDGRIPQRTLSFTTHEAVPAQVEAARFIMRFYTGLDLDSGELAAAGAALSASAGDLIAPQAIGDPSVAGLDETVLRGPREQAIPVESVPSATFDVQTALEAPRLLVGLRAPDGTVYGESGGPGVTYSLTNTTAFRLQRYEVSSPAVGTWTLLVDVQGGVPAGGVPVRIGANLPSPIKLVADTDRDGYAPGDSITLRANLTRNATPLTGMTVNAIRTDTSASFELFDDGLHGDGAASDGVYGAVRASDADVEGILRYTVEARGSAPEGDFLRNAVVDASVFRVVDAAIAAAPSLSPTNGWGGDAVTLGAMVRSEGERAILGRVIVSFYAGDPITGAPLLATATTLGPIAVGDVVEVTAPATAPVGTFTLYARVDLEDLEADLADNVARTASPISLLPRTQAYVSGQQGGGGWYVGNVTVRLGPFDGSAPQGTTEFVLDGGTPTLYSGPFVASGDGEHVLNYRSTSADGRIEPMREARFRIDSVAPTGEFVTPQVAHIHASGAAVPNPHGATIIAGPIDIDVAASDARSGVRGVKITLDGTLLGTARLENGTYRYRWDPNDATLGNHVLGAIIEDEAGLNSTRAMRVYVTSGKIFIGPGAVGRLTP